MIYSFLSKYSGIFNLIERGKAFYFKIIFMQTKFKNRKMVFDARI